MEMLSAHMRGSLLYYPTPPVMLRTTPPALEPPTQTMFARGPVGGGHSGAVMFGHTLPCHCEGVRSTLETLAYDCGNPVQCVCGRYARSTFLFTGSPRFARDDNGDEVRVLECSTPPPDGLIVYNCPNATYHMGRWALYYLAAEAPGITGVMDPPGTGVVIAVGL